ncbi:uncharacterized protein PRCAT00002213001 [Priceomyces carsonii]|uniref:uncharacterized protein n=1 Tax=Priceomyces carsonii TaxID=28549 RepID=UPI002ED97E2B|nr:unnamed protein product [Priceomyces carsonii]
MAKNKDIVSQITDLLSLYLNRDVNDNLTLALIKFYKQDNSFASFRNHLNVLGLKDEEKVKEVYSRINDNINILEKKLTGGSDITIQQRSKSGQKKRPKINLNTYEDEEDDGQRIEERQGSTAHEEPLIKLELDEELPKRDKIKFKRIKKEDAHRIKQETNDTVVPASEPNKKSEKSIKRESVPVTLSDLADIERNSIKKEEEDKGDLKIDDELNIENDREWYMSEDFGNAVDDTMFDSLNYVTPKQNNSSRKKMQYDGNSGGKFDDVTGEYIDFDHDSNYDDFSRIPVVSHLHIPPFLESQEESISLQLTNNSGMTRIGPTINPVKDPNSELAILAKNGSFVVKEKRSKIERGNQAKDRSTLSGTAMGNVLGVNDKPENDNSDNMVDEQNDAVTESDRQRILRQRLSLPAFAVRDDLLKTIDENQVTIVIGETGSGKTTQLTQYLYEEKFGKSLSHDGIRKMIGCTQPRRVAAMSVATRVSQEMDCKLGKEVGFAIRFEDRTDFSSTVIKYMTDGVLLREILVDPNLENYSCIIMDEAHERSLNTDVLLGLFKQLLNRRKDLKLIVTSATMNAERFSQFYGNAPQFIIPGRTFPVDTLFSKSSCLDYVEAAVKQVLTIHLQNTQKGNDGDILVFMTGQEDIEITCELIKEKLELLDDPPPLDVLPIYSTLPADLQKRIFNKKNSRRRKVVVATNIAETSLTVDGIKYVVDTGLVKLKVYNPKLGMDTLQVVPISLANAQQRSGRAGRTGPGVAYRLYTERASLPQEMYVQPIPEIQRTNLSNVMLMLKSLKVSDASLFPFLDPPPPDLLSCALYDLWSIGALNNLGDLTDLGKSMTRFPMEPTLSKLIILSCKEEFHCSEEIISIVSVLSVPSVYYRPKERAREADLAREKFLIADSDHLTLLNIFRQWELNFKKSSKNLTKVNRWCSKNFLQAKSLLRAKDIKNQLLLIMKKNKLPILGSRSDEDIKKCLCASFYQQLAKLVKMNINGSSEFINLRHNYMKMYLHPTSALNEGGLTSKYVIYHELILTSKEYMNYVTAVDPLWLLEFGFVFYEVADNYKHKLKHLNLDLDRNNFKGLLEEDKTRYMNEKQKRLHVGRKKVVSNPQKFKIRRKRAF